MEKNWAGNITYSTNNIHTPDSISELQALVKQTKNVRVLGSRHSFNTIADSNKNLISLVKLPQFMDVDHDNQLVTVSGHIKYGTLSQALDSQGFALHNLASLPHISVAGACATGTHGSGVTNGNLATAVTALELITANGEIVQLSKAQNPDMFDGVVVNLGILGIVSKMTLTIEPTYQVRQSVYQNLTLSDATDHFDTIMASAYSVSFFTDWTDETINQVWLKERITPSTTPDSGETLFSATRADRDLHPLAGMSAENCTPQMGVAGSWYERLPHFRMGFTPSGGEELQTEYFVAKQDAIPALLALNELRHQIAPLIYVTEIRTIATDSLWLSPNYERDCVAFHFTWQPRWPEVQALLPIIETALAPFQARPHWGKLFTMSSELVKLLYPRLSDFQALANEYDPTGKFRNAFVARFV